MKLTAKHIFLLKMITGMILAMHAGEAMANIAVVPYWESGHWGHFLPEFFYTFFPFTCIAIMQWLLFSDYLPNDWAILGLLGSLIASITIGFIFLELTQETYNNGISMFNADILGILFSLPQWFILKGKRGHLWVLANGIGLIIYFIGWNLIANIQGINQFWLGIERITKAPL